MSINNAGSSGGAGSTIFLIRGYEMYILLSKDFIEPKRRDIVVQKAFLSNTYCIIYPAEIKLLKKYPEYVLQLTDNESVKKSNRISMYQ